MIIQVFIGTAKGAFIATSDTSRTRWSFEGPLLKGWSVTAAARLDDSRYVVATASDIYGPALHVGSDLRSLMPIPEGPKYEGGQSLEQIWTLTPAGDEIYAGVADAGLFHSRGDLLAWEPVPGLNDHPTRRNWIPGAGGLCAHAVLASKNSLWCGISAVGVFRSDDGGASWNPKNDGVEISIPDQEFDGIGYCVHGLAADPHDPNRIYRQDHRGVYRTLDGGDSWEKIEAGLPSGFGFPIAVDSRGFAYVVPLESDEYHMPPDGRFRVFRSADGGDSWQPVGDPLEKVYTSILRGALDVDELDPSGIYVGTSSGTVMIAANGGWQILPAVLPRINLIRTFTLS